VQFILKEMDGIADGIVLCLLGSLESDRWSNIFRCLDCPSTFDRKAEYVLISTLKKVGEDEILVTFSTAHGRTQRGVRNFQTHFSRRLSQLF